MTYSHLREHVEVLFWQEKVEEVMEVIGIGIAIIDVIHEVEAYPEG